GNTWTFTVIHRGETKHTYTTDDGSPEVGGEHYSLVAATAEPCPAFCDSGHGPGGPHAARENRRATQSPNPGVDLRWASRSRAAPLSMRASVAPSIAHHPKSQGQ